MTDRSGKFLKDFAFRLGGGLLLLIAWLVGRFFVGQVQLHHPDGVTGWDLILGMVTFAATSMGSILVSYGHHVLDRIEVARRWQSWPSKDGFDPANEQRPRL
jgi:hypothetical protein